MRILPLLLTLFSLTVAAQPTLSTKSKKAAEYYYNADNYRVRGQYKQAIELLEQAIDKDANFFEAYFRLGQTYKQFKQYAKANAAFEAGLKVIKDQRMKSPFWYELGESYFLSGNYSGAQQLLTNYIQNDVASMHNKARFDQAKRMIDNAMFALTSQQVATQYQQRPLSDTVNCFPLQYFPVLTADQQSLIYTRRVGNKDTDDEDIVISIKDANGKWTAPISISGKINTDLNEGTSAISADGRKLIFTSCVGRDGWGSCDLYESNKAGDEWSSPKNLGSLVNSPDWESQPSLSADGRTLYFVSDRKGGMGRRDIWVSTQDAKGNWTRARNLGREVNTFYDEISPFIHANNNTLYYATNGLTGFGGYDIFYTEREKGKWQVPKNLGAPINNHEDQFSLFITADGAKAYYSHESVSETGHSKSRIYETIVPENSRVKRSSSFVKGIVLDKESRQPLQASIELIDIERDTLDALTRSDSVNGNYLMVLTKGSQYALYVTKPGYLFQSLSFDYTSDSVDSPVLINIELEKIKKGSTTVLNNIFFEFDSYAIKQESYPELGRILQFMKDNPAVSIEVAGHTDSKGSEEYNKRLSLNRAQAVTNYLVKNGIPQKRVFFKGMGSTNPVATNETLAGQQKNRRIEFRVL